MLPILLACSCLCCDNPEECDFRNEMIEFCQHNIDCLDVMIKHFPGCADQSFVDGQMHAYYIILDKLKH